MTKPDYSQFDALLIDAISNGKSRMMQLEQHKPLLEMAKPFCVAVRSRYAPEPFRIIDRRLQALRKAGKIKHSHTTGWTIV